MPVVVAVATAVPSASALASGAENEFHQTNLISNRTDQGAQVVDANLKNAWGLALSPTSPLWVADNGTSVATVYNVSPGGATASNAGLTVTLPPADSAPTGQVFNGTGGCPPATRRSGSGRSTDSSTSAMRCRMRKSTMTWPGPVTGSSTSTPTAGSWWSAWFPAVTSTPPGVWRWRRPASGRSAASCWWATSGT